ncbi:MAG TPA: barstar family protein [Devosia sp.]|nr:barstar family protein [Devosia sp.]
MAEPRQVVLDGASWQSRDDVYRAIATAIGAPSYFGRNLDALWDILQTPEDGARKPSYELQVRGTTFASAEARQTIADIAAVFAEARASSQDVDFTILD